MFKLHVSGARFFYFECFAAGFNDIVRFQLRSTNNSLYVFVFSQICFCSRPAEPRVDVEQS